MTELDARTEDLESRSRRDIIHGDDSSGTNTWGASLGAHEPRV
jgi:hypothetical protein